MGRGSKQKEVTVKRAIALIIAAAALAAIVASAPVSAGTPADKRVVVLEQQVKALQGQVKALKTQVTVVRKTVDSNQNDVRNGFARQRVGDACLAIAVADVFQSTWTNVDQRVPAGPAFVPAGLRRCRLQPDRDHPARDPDAPDGRCLFGRSSAG